MKSFEDAGYACLDNIPPVLTASYLLLADASGYDRAAVALDVRSGGMFGNACDTLDTLDTADMHTELLFLEATDEMLIRRYSETRRRHPHAAADVGLVAAIAAERAALAPLRLRANHVWDTTHLTHGMLKERVMARFGSPVAQTHVAVLAFGFKFGVPLDADFVFDVRFLPNPHYDDRLRPQTGRDRDVVAYLEAAADLEPFLQHLFGIVDFVVPRARAEGKARLTFAIGCTGGRHRSVYVATRLAEHLRVAGETIATIDARDIDR